jgi:hypothetical protein
MIAVMPHGLKRVGTTPYVTRALEANTPITRLIVVGAAPYGITPDDYWESPNTKRNHENVNGHLRLAATRLLEEGVESFVWIADDTFPLKPWTPVTHVRPFSIAAHLAEYPNIRGYSNLIRISMRVMRAEGYDPHLVPCGAIHRPMLVETKRVLQTLDKLPAESHFKSLYVAGLKDVVPTYEAGIKTRTAVPKPTVDCISTAPPSWAGEAGKFIRRKLSEPSRWETI